MNSLTKAAQCILFASKTTIVEITFEPFGSERKATLRVECGGQECLYRAAPTGNQVQVTLERIEGHKITEATCRRRTKTVDPEDVASAMHDLWTTYKVVA